MKISIIVAHDENNAIGFDNKLPWRLSKDLQHFKKVTMGKPIIMGRITFNSIGRALPGRTNIVITRDNSFGSSVCEYKDGDTEVKALNSIDQAFEHFENKGIEEVVVIGGGQIYEQVINSGKVDKFYITKVHTKVPNADTYFPEVRFADNGYGVVHQEMFLKDASNEHDFTITELTR